MEHQLHIDLADIAMIIASFIAVLVAGVIGAKKTSHAGGADFVLAGRSLTLPFFVSSLVATWYGAVLGSGEFVMRYGVVFIICFGVPYYLVAIVYARWLSKRIRSSKAVSIPDQLGIAYGPRARTVSALIMLVITIPAAYQLMLGIIVQSLTGWSLLASIIIATVLSTAYVYKGGLRSDVYANVVQFVLMYAGFIALVIACISAFGSPLELFDSLPTSHLSIPGELGWMPVIVWFVVAMQTFIDPNFHIRAAAANSTSTAQKGIYISVGLWMLFDVLQLLAGLYAFVHIKSVAPTDTYMNLAQVVLPSLWKGLFVSGVIAAVMSTLDGYALVSATTIGHDLIDRWNSKEPRVTSLRVGLLITVAIGASIAWYVPSIIDLMYNAASIAVPALLVPLLLSFTPLAERFQRGIVPNLLIPAIASAASLIANVGEPMFVGLVTSFILHLLRSLRRGTQTLKY